jgi:hypothetical protein
MRTSLCKTHMYHQINVDVGYQCQPRVNLVLTIGCVRREGVMIVV